MYTSNNDNMLIYQSADGKIKIDVRFEKETVWLTQAQMCVLFGRERSVITWKSHTNLTHPGKVF